MQLLQESTSASALRQSQGGEHRWAFLSSLWLIMVLGKFSLCSWPICRWGLLHLDQTGNGTHPDPDDEGDTLGRQQILGALPWSCCLSWLTSSLQTADFASSLQAASSLLYLLSSQLGQRRHNVRITLCCCWQLPPSRCSCLKIWVSKDLMF